MVRTASSAAPTSQSTLDAVATLQDLLASDELTSRLLRPQSHGCTLEFGRTVANCT